MISSLQRIIVIGRNTFTEAVRQKILNVLLVFALLLVSVSAFVSQLATPDVGNADTSYYAQQIKFVKDCGCGCIGWFGFFIAVLSTAQLIPQELHNRTIYTILSKPVRRSEFLLGKFLGVVLLLALCVAIMSLAFAASMYLEEIRDVAATQAIYATTPNWQSNPLTLNAYNHDVDQIVASIRDPYLIASVLLIFGKLIMATAIALVISTFATSWVFTVITTSLIFVIGNLESVAREFWLARGAETSLFQSALVGLISMLIPDMNAFTIGDEILAGNIVPWHHTFDLLGYAGAYVLVLLAVSVVIFNYREI